jgi:excisionase family DNA binding protein
MEGTLTLTIEEAASLLGVSRSTAYEAAKTGQLTAGVRVIKVGQRMLAPRIDVERIFGPISLQ